LKSSSRNRPQQVREIYDELRSALGSSAEPDELLECAAMLVKISERQVGTPRYNFREGRTPFEELSLHELYSSCPWRLVCEEVRVEDDFVGRQTPSALFDELIQMAA